MLHRISFNGHAAFIGSLPHQNHKEALDLVLKYSPCVPAWAQLPCYKKEGMINQTGAGLPGFDENEDGDLYLNINSDNFQDELLQFYENYLSVEAGSMPLESSPFAMPRDISEGLWSLLESLKGSGIRPECIKGQMCGVFSFLTSIKDQDGKQAIYDDTLKDIGSKMVAFRAKWQAEKLLSSGYPAVLFLDEPGLAGFGSSAFITISKEDIQELIKGSFKTVHESGAMVGVHVCANTDWSILLESSVDVINFDAYEYFDKFLLFKDEIIQFIKQGGQIAWGIVPTMHEKDIKNVSPEYLANLWKEQVARLQGSGVSMGDILKNSLITPSCGTGTLSPFYAERVLWLTSEASKILRKTVF